MLPAQEAQVWSLVRILHAAWWGQKKKKKTNINLITVI